MNCPVCAAEFKPSFARQATCGNSYCIAENKRKAKKVEQWRPEQDLISPEVRQKNKFLLRGIA